MSVNLMLFTGYMFELTEIHQASSISDGFGCSQAPTQTKPYNTAKVAAEIDMLCHHRQRSQFPLCKHSYGTSQVLLTSL